MKNNLKENCIYTTCFKKYENCKLSENKIYMLKLVYQFIQSAKFNIKFFLINEKLIIRQHNS